MNKFLSDLLKPKEIKPPAVMFGRRLVVVKNDKVPKDHILLCVHPDVHEELAAKINQAFAEWSKLHSV